MNVLAIYALLATWAIEVPLVAILFPGQRVRMAGVAFIVNAATNLTLNVGLPMLAMHDNRRIMIGEIAALVVEAIAYVMLARRRDIGRAIVASALGNGLSFTMGGALIGLILRLT